MTHPPEGDPLLACVILAFIIFVIYCAWKDRNRT
jgi:hypothetical protein